MEKLIVPFSILQRKNITRWIFTGVLLLEVYLFASNLLFHQLRSPKFIYLDFDITYYIFQYLNLPQLFTANAEISLILDIILVSLTITCIIFPLKRIFLVAFYLLFFCYMVTRNTFGLFHEHLFNGVIFAAFPFLFARPMTAKLLWEFARYIVLFIYFSAFLWKFLRGSFFQFDHVYSIIQESFSSSLLNDQNWFHPIYRFFLAQPTLVFVLGLLVLLLEAVYIVGYFTKKYDLWLFWIGVALHLGFWFFVDIFFFPIIILHLTLLPFSKQAVKNE